MCNCKMFHNELGFECACPCHGSDEQRHQAAWRAFLNLRAQVRVDEENQRQRDRYNSELEGDLRSEISELRASRGVGELTREKIDELIEKIKRESAWNGGFAGGMEKLRDAILLSFKEPK